MFAAIAMCRAAPDTGHDGVPNVSGKQRGVTGVAHTAVPSVPKAL